MNWLWVGLAYLSLFIFGLSDNLRGPLFPDFLKEFGVSHIQGSLFFSTSSLISMLGALLAPRMIRRWGHVRTLLVFLGLSGVAFFGYGLALSFLWMIFCAAMFGVSVGGLGVTQNLLVLQGSDEAHRRQAQSGLHSCYGASSLLAPWIVTGLAALGFRWNTSFFVPVVLILVMILGVFVIRGRWKNEGQGMASEPVLAGDLNAFEVQSPEAAPETLNGPISQAWTAAEIYWAILLAVYVAIEIMVSSRMSLLLREGFGRSLEDGNLWTSIFFVGLFAGRLVSTFVSLPGRLSHWMKGSMLMAAVLMLLGLWVRPEWLALSGLMLSIFYPLWMTAISQVFPATFHRVASVGVGLTGVSVVLMHTLLGGLSDQVGLVSAMYAVPVLTGIGFLMVVFFPMIFARRLP